MSRTPKRQHIKPAGHAPADLEPVDESADEEAEGAAKANGDLEKYEEDGATRDDDDDDEAADDDETGEGDTYFPAPAKMLQSSSKSDAFPTHNQLAAASTYSISSAAPLGTATFPDR